MRQSPYLNIFHVPACNPPAMNSQYFDHLDWVIDMSGAQPVWSSAFRQLGGVQHVRLVLDERPLERLLRTVD
jgi:hypothetical protein